MSSIQVKHRVEDYLVYPKLFLETFCFIKPKTGQKIPFVFNNYQNEYYEMLMDLYWKPYETPDGYIAWRFQGMREINLKARQWGLSTLTCGLFYHSTIMNLGTDTKVYCQDEDYSKKMLEKYKFFYDHQIPDIYYPEANTDNKEELGFKSLYSAITYGTPGATRAVQRKQGRSTTIFNLHLSEYAEFPDARTTFAGLEEVVPDEGNMLIESSPNVIGDHFHVIYNKAKEGDSEWRARFWPWFGFDPYQREISDFERGHILDTLQQDEIDLIEKFDLSIERIAWRRMKIRRKHGDVRAFIKEHPEDDESCFEAEAELVFDTEERKKRCMPREYAIPGHVHSIGVDVGLGIEGGDFSAIVVIDVNTMEQVYEWHGHISPANLIYKVHEIWQKFPGLIGIESNNFGYTTVMESYKIDDFLKPKPGFLFANNKNPGGWMTTKKNKPHAIFGLKTSLREASEGGPGLKLSSKHIVREMSWFQHFEGTKMGAPQGSFEGGEKLTDDSVMALMIAHAMIDYIWQIEKQFTKRFGKPSAEHTRAREQIIIPIGRRGRIDE